jgi:RNA polymerase sigma-70 factor (ECF subfamily)
MGDKSMSVLEACCLYNKKLFHIAYSITRDEKKAKEIAQLTITTSIKELGNFVEKKTAEIFLSKIAAKTAIECVRKERKLLR